MKSIILAAALAAAPIAAMAGDLWQLHARGHWTVYATEDDDGMLGCMAINSLPAEDLAFSITVNRWGINGNISAPDMNFRNGTTGKISVWIDRRNSWDVISRAGGQLVWFDIPQTNNAERFIREIYHGQRVYIDLEQDGQWDYWFSLQGSAAAINALIDCRAKVGF